MSTAKICDGIHSRRELWEQPLNSSCVSNHIQLGSLGHMLPMSQCTTTSPQCYHLLCNPRKTCEHSSAIIQRLSQTLMLNPPCSFHMKLWHFFKWQIFFFFPMVCLRRVLLNSSAVLAIDNNVISHPAWVWIKSATAFSMKSALSTLAAQLATG